MPFCVPTMTEVELIQTLFAELKPVARDFHRRRESLATDTKRHATDYVTEADRTIQRRLIERIHEHFPNDNVMAEEEGYDLYPEDPSARCWIIDPIDGTQNFIRSLQPLFSISVAFAQNGVVHAGGLCFPLFEDLFLAQRGAGATHNGAPSKLSTIDDLRECRVEIDHSNPSQREEILQTFAPLFHNAGQIRYHGAATIGIASVACGAAEAYCHVRLNTWDFAAGMLIVEEAGGRATRIDGSPVTLHESPQSIIISNGVVHDTLIDTLRMRPHARLGNESN